LKEEIKKRGQEDQKLNLFDFNEGGSPGKKLAQARIGCFHVMALSYELNFCNSYLS